MFKNTISINGEKQFNSTCEYNKPASFSITAKQDSDIKWTEKSLKIFNAPVINMPAKPILK